MAMEKSKLGIAAFCLLAASAWAQTATPADVSKRVVYPLGPDDVITIKASDAEEISDKPIRIATNGTINLPMVGRLQVSGLTVEEVEKELVTRLKPYIRNPEVSVSVVELKSQPVSVIGSVQTPGVQQLQGRKTLVEMLSLAGGLRTDAGYNAKITREKEWGPIPLPNCAPDSTGKYYTAEVNLKKVMDGKTPEENIAIMPHDVISVPKAQMVYVIGDVKKAGALVLGEVPSMSVLQALSMASGLERTASATHSKILRVASAGGDQKRTEIEVNLKNILAGKAQDVPLQPEDILYVPGSKSRAITVKALETMVQIGSLSVIRY